MPWFRRLLRRAERYNDLTVSIREHLAERVEELTAEGISEKEAESTARREFGNITLVEERSREVWQWPSLESLWRDVKHAFRQLLHNRGFAATVLLTLALCVGANTAIFSIVNALLLENFLTLIRSVSEQSLPRSQALNLLMYVEVSTASNGNCCATTYRLWSPPWPAWGRPE